MCARGAQPASLRGRSTRALDGTGMPRFGDTNVFAVDVEDDATPQSPRGTLWGRARVWVAGASIGDFSSEHCGLSGFHQNLLDLSMSAPRLECEAVAALSPLEAFCVLYAKLYDDGDQSDASVAFDAAIWSRFVFLTNTSEAFNGANGFVHSLPGLRLRILVRGDEPAKVVSVTLPWDDFNAVVGGFDAWANQRSAV